MSLARPFKGRGRVYQNTTPSRTDGMKLLRILFDVVLAIPRVNREPLPNFETRRTTTPVLSTLGFEANLNSLDVFYNALLDVNKNSLQLFQPIH